jgi:uncharacterized protein (TIGR00725 family)
MARRPVIGVIGGQRPPPQALADAEAVGRLVAAAGAVLVCGGLGGVMEAACRGAKAAGGLTIGILPGGEAAEANASVDVSIVTAMGTARNVIVVRTADALVAVDGSYGTLSEIAHALDLGKRVVSLGSWDLGRAGVDPTRILAATTPEEAVRLALAEATRGASAGRSPVSPSLPSA